MSYPYRSAAQRGRILAAAAAALAFAGVGPAGAQETDVTQTPNTANAGIQKSLTEEIGLGRGDEFTPDSSLFIVRRDPFRAIARGRQLFQRKFTHADGAGPRAGDGIGDVETNPAPAAGLTDSCAACHGRPRGSAGFGGNVFTRPDSRDAPHLFGLGLVEMLADEITADLRATRDDAVAAAEASNQPAYRRLRSKGLRYGWIGAAPDGTLDTRFVRGVDPDLRVKPFFAQGGKFSIRQFCVGAFNDEMGLQSPDPDLAGAAAGGTVVTPAGLVLDGSQDVLGAPPAADDLDDADGDGVSDEIPPSVIDFMEFYLLNYFRPAAYRQGPAEQRGAYLFDRVGCTQCHVPDLPLREDRRVADVDTRYDPAQGGFNSLFATATPLVAAVEDGSGQPALQQPLGGAFLVEGIYADFRRHDLGPAFHERNFDGTVTTEFMTEPLWGVGSTPPYGHDGRSINLREVILRHGGEAERARDRYAHLRERDQQAVEAFLSSLVLFPPPDTASNLDPGDPTDPGYPQAAHGSINLSVLFLDPADKE